MQNLSICIGKVGEYLSELCAESSFGDKVIDEVADFISRANPTIKEFNRRGLYRMRQFYETYKDAVVEYALSRSMSPTLVSYYTLCLPDKHILKDKLQELAELVLEHDEDINE